MTDEEKKLLVYWLEEPSDLVNVLAISPTAPVMTHEGRRSVYVMHTPYDLVFILETEEPMEEVEIPFRGEAQVNKVKVRRVRSMTHEEFASYLSWKG
ncbi:MAG: hypothetical protein ACE5KH_05750 [Candidatus Geothermarchaeales archaeon]